MAGTIYWNVSKYVVALLWEGDLVDSMSDQPHLDTKNSHEFKQIEILICPLQKTVA